MKYLIIFFPIHFLLACQVYSQSKIDTSRFVYVKGGEYLFHNIDKKLESINTTNPVSLNVKGFYISKTELTVSEFAEFVKESHYRTDIEKKAMKAYIIEKKGWTRLSAKINWRCDAFGRKISKKDYNRPVLFLSIRDIENYCGWAGVRLPKEEEWEYAAKKGIEGMESYYWSHLSDYAWYDNIKNLPTESQTHKVGLKKPDQSGIYDLSGNVAEICIEYSDNRYTDESSTKKITNYVAKGGSANLLYKDLNFINNIRLWGYDKILFYHIGYRVCLDKD